MPIRRFSLSLVLSAISLAVSAQSPAFDAASHEREVDAFMQQQMTARQIPGAAVAVVRGGRVILVKGYGVADVEHRVPVTEHTVFELASVTKPFTAMAIMMLVQDGKLSLDARIADVVADLPAAWRAVTIRQLLTHTSGIAEFARPAFNMNARKDYKPREIIQLVADAPLDFPPGERHSYSNTGYVLLGMAIETLSAKDTARSCASESSRRSACRTPDTTTGGPSSRTVRAATRSSTTHCRTRTTSAPRCRTRPEGWSARRPTWRSGCRRKAPKRF